MDYSFKEVKTGRAYQDVLLNLGWTKPRKNEATFQKAMPGGLIFEANFLYAYSDHYEEAYSGAGEMRVWAAFFVFPWKIVEARVKMYFVEV